MMDGEDTETYAESILPMEMQDMDEGQEMEKVCKVKRKGDKLCITHCDGHPLNSVDKATKASTKASESENPGPKKPMKPSQFMMAQPGMQKY